MPIFYRPRLGLGGLGTGQTKKRPTAPLELTIKLAIFFSTIHKSQFYNTTDVIFNMEQITLVFLIGAFILFLLQLKWKKEIPLKMIGLFASVSVIALSLIDPELATEGESFAIMVLSGFALTMYSLLGLYKEV